jgi:HSP20 family protein
MTTTRWDPFNDLLRIQERMNRMFEDSLVQTHGGSDPTVTRGSWTPAVDIYETPDSIVLLADLPGIVQEDLDLRVEGNTLVLRGERRMEKDLHEENFHRMERGTGAFQRSFTLPASIEQNGIRAEHRSGVLRVELPKAQGAQARKIHVEMPSPG